MVHLEKDYLKCSFENYFSVMKNGEYLGYILKQQYKMVLLFRYNQDNDRNLINRREIFYFL